MTKFWKTYTICNILKIFSLLFLSYYCCVCHIKWLFCLCMHCIIDTSCYFTYMLNFSIYLMYHKVTSVVSGMDHLLIFYYYLLYRLMYCYLNSVCNIMKALKILFILLGYRFHHLTLLTKCQVFQLFPNIMNNILCCHNVCTLESIIIKDLS